MDTLISNVTVVTMNPRMDVLFGAYIAIEDGKILSIEKSAPEGQPKTIIDEITHNGEKFGRQGLYVVMVKYVTPVLLAVLLAKSLNLL